MITLFQLWLPILLSAVGVFVASSVLHMALKFWHQADYRGFSNENDVAAAIRKGSPAPGIYTLPFCRMEDMQKPETQEKFKQGPVGMFFLRASGAPNMGIGLTQWFLFCLLVSVFAAYLAAVTLTTGMSGMQVARIVGVAAFMAYGFASLPAGIWWGQPWKAVFKDVIDGAIYATITALVFAWLWPVDA